MKKKMLKTTKNNFITYGMVIAIFVVVQILSSTGNLSRLLTGLLVPICVYIIASLSLNLVVGYSGELSLGHAGFMCVGAYSSALFSHVTSDVLPSVPRLILALLVGAAVAAVFAVIFAMIFAAPETNFCPVVIVSEIPFATLPNPIDNGPIAATTRPTLRIVCCCAGESDVNHFVNS